MRSEESGESGESDYDAAKMQVEVLLEYVEISTRPCISSKELLL
jgi:hypothetical protein